MVPEWRRLAPSLVVLVAEIVVAVVVATTLNPSVREFVVWDATIDRTYQANSTIPFWATIFVPLVSLLLAIAVRNRSNLRGVMTNGELSWVLFFITAGITTAIVTEVLKNLVGRYRPDWLDRCLPPVPGEVIIDTWGAPSSENPPCTNTDISASKLDDGMKSFPSGHSSTAFSLGTVCVAHAGWWMLGSGGRDARPTPFLATVLELWMALQISWAIGVASSRIMDNKHHVGDVVGGGLIGVLFGSLYSLRAIIESMPNDSCQQDTSDSDERSILRS